MTACSRIQPGPVAVAVGALVVSAVLVAAPAHATTATTFYVSPSGSDTNSGLSADAPFRTLTQAQAAVRALDKSTAGAITVYLAGGTYRLTSPLTFTGADSQTASGVGDIWWKAESGQFPVISGADQISGWTMHDGSKNIWRATVPSNLNTRELYVNGVRATRATGSVPVALTQTSTGYTTSSGDPMASWGNVSGDNIEFVYQGGLGAWTEPRCPVASITSTTITMAQPCWDNSTKRVMRTDGSGRTYELVGRQSITEQPTAVENSYDLLDTPGEWYLNTGSDNLYYIPRPGEDMTSADVEAPALNTLLTTDGDSGAEFHSVGFQGIQFSYATDTDSSTGQGFSEIQATYQITGSNGYAVQGLCGFVSGGTCPYGNWTKMGAAVDISNNHNVHFDHDYFVHLGGAGLDLGDGSRNDTVTACVFTDISGNGLDVGGVDINEGNSTQATSGITVKDSHVYNIGAEYHSAVGIDVGYVQDTTFTHNQIDQVPYSGISVGWGGWPDKIEQPAEPNNSQGNVFSNNLIEFYMQLLNDGGAIYTNGITGSSLSNGEQITGNLIHDGAAPAGHTIYTDNGASYVTITGNGEYNIGSDAWGSDHTNYTANDGTFDPLDIEGNYWPNGPADYNAKSVLIQNNHNITSSSDIPSSISSNAGIESQYQSILSWTPAS